MKFKSKANIKAVLLMLVILCILTFFSSCKGKITEKPSYTESNAQTETLPAEKTKNPILSRDEIFQKLKLSVVKVLGYDYDGKTLMSQGTGFFIDNNGTFITNAHVVRDCYYIKIRTYFNTVYDVDVMYTYNDSTSDYAICGLEVDYSSIPVEFAESAEEGDIVYALGYPKDAFDMNTTSGKIISADAVDGDKHYYINSAYIDHGSSGGALIDTSGRVLGLTTGSTSGGEFVTLKYSDFKADIENAHSTGKPPYKYFHNVLEYKFFQSTMNVYFDIIVNVTADSDTSVEYAVTVALKDEYRDMKMVLDTSDISTVTVALETKYNYYAIGSDSTEAREHITTDTMYFNFNSLEELKKGITLSSTSSVLDLISADYYGMDISYVADFWVLQNGSFMMYS